jgi:hypothetical protein
VVENVMKCLWFVLFLVGCDDDYFLPDGGDTVPVTGDGWCAVKSILANECSACHGSGALGGLDVVTDPYPNLVNKAAAADAARTLVIPGDADNSFLYQKLLDNPPVGGVMPPGGALEPASLEIIRAWIADGATEDECSGTDTDVVADGYHPDGFALPDEHGAEAKLQIQECVDCHGATLEGTGPAVSCDTCHAAGWREDCTFCHGDQTTGEAAPPRHISGVDDGVNASFIPHLTHVQETAVKRALDCTECHVRPTDVLSVGHLFVSDDSPGVAEVDFSTSLANAATWNNGTCATNYCHGNGRADNGRVAHTASVDTCHDCHPDMTSGRDAWGTMSGRHEDHVREGLQCWECHGDTTNAAMEIVGLPLHVNGTKDVALRAGMDYNNDRCTGACHGESHVARAW